jgi:signal transduction histidine kinase
MQKILKFIWPGSLVGQIVLVAAIALFVAQAVGGFLLLGTMRARALNEATVVLVQRIGNHVERQVEIGKAPTALPKISTRPRHAVYLLSGAKPLSAPSYAITPEIQQRAIDMFDQSNTPLKNISLQVGLIADLPPEIRAQQIGRARKRLEHRSLQGVPHEAVILSAQASDGQWITGVTSVRPRERRSMLALLFQTVLLYLAVLIPLLLIARRIAKPLAGLKDNVQRIGGSGDFTPLNPAGPDDVRNLMMAFNAMQVRVSSLLSEKDVMLGAIGHDLKTPLASLRVRIESIDDDEEREKMAATIDEMAKMLDDILTLARNGKSGEDAVKTDIGSLIDTLIQEYSNDQAALSFDAPAPKIIAAVRPILLRRAIRNLIDNALLYAGHAQISLQMVEQRLQIAITDTGPGIPAEALEYMFEPFARAEKSRGRTTGGSGLGLTIARAIARNHDGDVILRNNAPGPGLTAIIDLPLA